MSVGPNTAIIAYSIDAAEFLAKSKALAALPETIRSVVLPRGFRAVARASESRVVKDVAAETQMRQKDVRETIRTASSDHDVVHICRSPWIPLAKLGGARQTRTGVTVRGWGAHAGVFIVARYGGNIFQRYGEKQAVSARPIHGRVSPWAGRMKQRIRKLHGPNPANFINTHPDRYRKILEEEAERRLLPEVMRQLDLALDRLAG